MTPPVLHVLPMAPEINVRSTHLQRRAIGLVSANSCFLIDWVEDDLKNLCTGKCSSSLNAWYSSVENACSGDMILVNGKEVEPKLLPERYISTLR